MKIEWKTCLKIGVSAFILYLCISYWPAVARFLGSVLGAAMPLLIGCIIAYIVNILMSSYERHYFPRSSKAAVIKSRRPVCLLSAFLTLIIFIALLFWLVIPELVACARLLVAQVPDAISSLIDRIEGTGYLSDDIIASLQGIDWKARLEQIVGVVSSGIGDVVGTAINVVSSVFSGIVTALFAIISSIYILTSKEKLGSQFHRLMRRYMKRPVYDRSLHIISVMDDSFHRYIVGQCTEAIILGVLCAIGMAIFRFPYATMTGAVVAFTALIPVAGSYIGAGVGAFMILTVSPMKAVFFLIFIVVLQQLEGNLIYPRVVGSSLGLPAIWVLAAVTIGGGVMGILGMLLGVPLASALYKLLRENIRKGEMLPSGEAKKE